MHGPRASVRRAEMDDHDLLLALEQDIFPEDPWTPRMLAEELACPFSTYLLAFDKDGECLGYGGVKVVGETTDIMTIGVVTAARGRGFGRFLLAELMRVAHEGGAQSLFLEVRSSNLAARALYAAEGFHQIGVIRRYFRNPVEDAVSMRRDLCEPVSHEPA